MFISIIRTDISGQQMDSHKLRKCNLILESPLVKCIGILFGFHSYARCEKD